MRVINRMFVALPLVHVAVSKVWQAGVNIAGFDFGCGNTQGVYTQASTSPPLLSQGGADGIGQMQHFVRDDKLNVFRLPVCWQYLVNGTLGGNLNPKNFGVYNELVMGCLNTGAYCVIDIHNYARWENQTIGQSGNMVTNAHFASLWWQLADKYKNRARVLFGLMNEPHDLDTWAWATSLQWAVNSIRSATGQNTNMILLPGSQYGSVGGFMDSSTALATVSNPDGSKTNLIYDVHQYLDQDSTGTSTTCARNGVSELSTLAGYLRTQNRQAFLTETGGGNTPSCYTQLCAELDWMNYNSDVYLGWIGWAAGSFKTNYELSETPINASGRWTDTAIVTNCVAGMFNK